MSIGKQVSDALEKMDANDPEAALHAICSAIDLSATREYGKSGRSTFKAFLQDNFPLICQVTLGNKIINLNMEFDNSSFPQWKKRPDNMYPVPEIFYHAVRCNLYHKTELPNGVKFTDEKQIRCNHGSISLPTCLVFGIIIAVIVTPANGGESEPKMNSRIFNMGSVPLALSKLWGKRSELDKVR